MPHTIDTGLSATLHSAIGKIQRSLPTASAERNQAITPSPACDSLRLTGEAAGLQALQRELSSTSALDATRVQDMRDALANGSYRIHPDVIARRMLELDAQLVG